MNDVALALAQATQILEQTSTTPRLDAELLMAHALQINRNVLLLRLRDLSVPPHFDALVARRAAEEPVAYIRGHQDFWDLTLSVNPDTLIPRADSETLIEVAQTHYADKAPPRQILDLGTGSGALVLAALSLFPTATGVGIDASKAALDVAQSNADRLGFADRCYMRHASWRHEGWAQNLGTFDLILCNPPYIVNDFALMPSVHNFEPHTALFSGAEGLDDYTILIPEISEILSPTGIAIFEIGIGQAKAVCQLAYAAGLTASAHRDLAGIERALVMAARAV